MPEENIQQHIWQLLEKLPPELKDAFFSTDNSDFIYSTCRKYECLDKVSKIAEYSGHVLLGLLPPEDFQAALEGELKLEKETAEKMAREIHRFIYYPVKPALEQLYKTGAVSVEEGAEKPSAEKPERKPAGEDRYREVIE